MTFHATLVTTLGLIALLAPLLLLAALGVASLVSRKLSETATSRLCQVTNIVGLLASVGILVLMLIDDTRYESIALGEWVAIPHYHFSFTLVFDRLSQGGAVAETAWAPAVVFAVLAIGRNLVIWLGDVYWIKHWIEQSLQLRRNLLRWLLEAPGSRVIPLAPGEAVSTFRDDVDDVLEYMENWVDMGGLVVFGVGSVWIRA